ncbi:hypothetical protein [Roseivirga sp. E12]|uniref:hypothetical protein n=1 Tax=Roseivirga sp. E12 TaxID=2819237 RepID=UPI001ABC0638|nr:hypothetical protein [Roseivirga sp. E12]MBO3699169.1 hypothetical protein [Roseivirga sp. E12]
MRTKVIFWNFMNLLWSLMVGFILLFVLYYMRALFVMVTGEEFNEVNDQNFRSIYNILEYSTLIAVGLFVVFDIVKQLIVNVLDLRKIINERKEDND